MPAGSLPDAPTVLVTGATDGIGLETALELARRGARVIAHGRRSDAVGRVHTELERVSGRPHPDPVLVDFAELAAVRRLVRELERRGEAVHVVLNNAGVFMTERRVTADGIETTMAVNHYAPFVLVLELLAGPLGKDVRRIVNVSSVAHESARLDADEGGPPKRTLARFRGFDGYAAYAASKLANVLFTVELARRLGAQGPTVNALHPGVVTTKLLKTGFGSRGPDSLASGAETCVFLSLDPGVADTTGRYFVRARASPAHPDAANVEKCTRLFARSEALTGTKFRPVAR